MITISLCDLQMAKKNKKEKNKQAVLKTLIYSDIFNYPLTAEQLHRRLIVGADPCVRPGQTRGFVPTNVKSILDQLVSEGRVGKQGKYYFLPGQEEIVQLRKKREKYSGEKMKIARQTANLIKFIPTVKFVGVTGSVGAGNAQKKDDIDLMIVSSSGWLWTTRLLVTILVGLLGRRRRPNDKQVRNKICLNLFVDQCRLDVFDRNLFTAYELILLKPLVNRGNTYEKLLSANSWVKNYLPNAMETNYTRYQDVNYSPRSRTIVEKGLRQIQLWWMKKRRTTEITKPNLIAFHPNDIRRQIMIKYRSKLEKL